MPEIYRSTVLRVLPSLVYRSTVVQYPVYSILSLVLRWE